MRSNMMAPTVWQRARHLEEAPILDAREYQALARFVEGGRIPAAHRVREAAGPVMPFCNIIAMNLHLAEILPNVLPGVHGRFRRRLRLDRTAATGS